MAESHSNLWDNSVRLRKSVSKLAFRSREKVMRSFGRSEETKDEILDHYVMLINKQQIKIQTLQRDMKQYLHSLKAMSVSQKAFFNSLYEVYDDDWAGKDVVASCSQRSELLYDDIFARFQVEVLEPLQNHLTEYQQCRLRVEKRGRKLVDFDAARRSLQSLEAAKKPDGVKIDRAREIDQRARETYVELNNSLHEQLPTLYDFRLPVCVNTFSCICESEKIFSTEMTELRSKLNSVLLSLKSAYDNGEHRIERMQPPPLDNGKNGLIDGSAGRFSTPSTVSYATPEKISVRGPLPPPRLSDSGVHTSPSSDPSMHEYVNLQVGEIPDSAKTVTVEEESDPNNQRNKFPKPDGNSQTANGNSVVTQLIYEEPPREDHPSKTASPPNSPSKSVDSRKYLDLPPDYLFSVQALYHYRGSDDDELSFGKGEVLHIVKHPDPEDQDEGWQMGVRQKDWEEREDLGACMGVFPENFTKRIQL